MKSQNFLKTFLISWSMIASIYSQPCPGGGELKICVENQTSNKFYLSINSDGYCWDYNNSQVVIVNNYERSVTVTSGNYRFDSPTDKGSNIDTIPWGKFKVKIISFDSSGLARFSKSFYLNLKDENWSSGATYSDYQRDTWIIIDQSANEGNGSVFLRGFSRNGTELTRYIADYDSNSTINIWTFLGIASPNTSNFKVPITLFNKIENTEISFGYLKADTEEILSGDQGYFKYNTSQSVENGTIEKYENDVRNYSYKWSNSNRITPELNQNLYNGTFNFSTVIDVADKSITRNFRPVYPLTIKNSLDELVGISVDNVYFKDPTTTNSYEQKSASGSGFFKDNAFKDLNEIINNQPNQKYGAKAKSIIDYNGYHFQYSYGDFNTTGTDFLISAPTTKVVHYKGVQLSNTSTTYNNTSQNKFLKTYGGGTEYLHNVYTSMGDIYYERSTDGGTIWTIMNDGKPINPYSEYAEAKSPAIACSDDGNDLIYITYQSTIDATGFGPVVMLTQFKNGQLNWHRTVYDLSGFSFSEDYQPVVAAMNGVVLVVFNPPSPSTLGLISREYIISYADNITAEYSRTLPNVDASSCYPSITAAAGLYHLAYQQAAFSIKYLRWTVNTNPLTSSYSSTPSTGSGYSLNTEPSISLAYFNPVVSWEGAQYTGSPQAVLRRGTLSGINIIWSDFLKVGSNANYVHNNSAYYTPPSTAEKTVMCLGENNSIIKWVKRTFDSGHTTYSTPANLSHTGIRSQITTGSDYNNMKANIFRSSSPLYYFTQSTTDFSVLQEQGGELNKITVDDTLVTFGRSGVAEINGVEFVFNIGDVLAGDSIIQFIDKPDTIVYASSNELNEFTRTNNFTLNPATNFYFSNIYYVVQKSDPDTALSTNDAVNFKVELVNAITDQVVGSFDNITYNKTNLEKYANIDYEVDCYGIIPGDYYLRLVTNVNGNANYALANIISDNTTLAKKNFNKVNFMGSEIPLTYELSNNFPNPFNPSTTIRYQIPQDGIVTLKIYDILGSEVATLVNEEKLAGKYEVNFNASGLASGVYIYKIQAGSFINSKKMILLK